MIKDMLKALAIAIIFYTVLGVVAWIDHEQTVEGCSTDTECEATDGRYGEGY